MALYCIFKGILAFASIPLPQSAISRLLTVLRNNNGTKGKRRNKKNRCKSLIKKD